VHHYHILRPADPPKTEKSADQTVQDLQRDMQDLQAAKVQDSQHDMQDLQTATSSEPANSANFTCKTLQFEPANFAENPPKKESPKDSQERESSLRSDSARARARARETELPDDWVATVKHIALAKSLGFDERGFNLEVDKMRSWAEAKGAKCIRWDSRFRIWLITASERLPRKPNGHDLFADVGQRVAL